MRITKKKYVWALSNAVYVNSGGESIFLETNKPVPLEKISADVIDSWAKQGAVTEAKNGINETD